MSRDPNFEFRENGDTYPKGFYSIETIDGIARPVPIPGIDPVATLIPE